MLYTIEGGSGRQSQAELPPRAKAQAQPLQPDTEIIKQKYGSATDRLPKEIYFSPSDCAVIRHRLTNIEICTMLL